MIPGIINYGGGNLHSVVHSIEHLGFRPRMVNSSDDLEGISHLVFPGQGAFGQCSGQLNEMGLFPDIRNWIQNERPFFGICIGYQLLFESSIESEGAEGLGVLQGKVRRFNPELGLKIPHMGWNKIELKDPSDKMWSGLSEEPYFYFVHSYFPDDTGPRDEAATCSYGEKFTAAIRHGQTWGCQFHPEKSQQAGIQLLKNFFDYTK